MLSRISVALAAATLLAPWACATTSRATAPVGFMRYDIAPGLQTLGFPMLNAPVASGRVDGTDTSSLFAAVNTPVGSRLDPTLAYYLEFTTGPDGDTTFVGDRLELDVARTADPANPGHRIRLQLGSAFSTLRVLPAELVGYRFVIRAHVTLASVFGTGADCDLRGGHDTATGDQVYLLQNGRYQSYLFQANHVTGNRSWVLFPEGNPADELPIAPGAGMFLRHVGSGTVTIRHVGDVRTNAFVQPLRAGQTLVSEPFPVANTFETRGMTDVNGFTAGPSAEGADTVSLWTGSSYHTLYYAAHATAAPAWRSVEMTAQSTAQETQPTFSPFRAVFVHKLTADPDYVVPGQF